LNKAKNRIGLSKIHIYSIEFAKNIPEISRKNFKPQNPNSAPQDRKKIGDFRVPRLKMAQKNRI
jgi:hypothetical protein